MNRAFAFGLAAAVLWMGCGGGPARAATVDADPYGPHQLVSAYFAGWSGPHLPCAGAAGTSRVSPVAVVQTDCDVVSGGMTWQATAYGQLFDRTTGLCLDPAGGAAVANVTVAEDNCADGVTTPAGTQSWTIAQDTAGYRFARNNANSQLCLTAYAIAEANGSYGERLEPCLASAVNQRFMFRGQDSAPAFGEGSTLTAGEHAIFDPTGCTALVYWYWLDAPGLSFADTTYTELRLLGWVNGGWKQLWDAGAQGLTDTAVQTDGNVVSYGDGHSSANASWATGTTGTDNELTLASGGDLQVVDASTGHVAWHTNTHVTCANAGALPSGIRTDRPIGQPWS